MLVEKASRLDLSLGMINKSTILQTPSYKQIQDKDEYLLENRYSDTECVM